MSVSVELWRPDGDCLSVDISKREFAQIMSDLGDGCSMMSHLIFFLEVEYTRNGQIRRALEEKLLDTYQVPVYCDAEDGCPVNKSSRRTLVWNLLPTTSLRSAPRRLQSLIVYVNTEVWAMSGSELKLVPFKWLFDPSFVLLLHGVRCGRDFLWRTTSLWLNDGATGELFRHRHNVPGGGAFRHIVAVFRDADFLPRIAVATGATLSARRKAGAELDVFRERVRVRRFPAASEEQRWEICPIVTDLEKCITETCSRGATWNRF